MNHKRPATEKEIARMKSLRAEGKSWEEIAPLFGMSRYWVRSVAYKNGFSDAISKKSPPVPTQDSARAAAGLTPLPAFHPLAMAELERAKGLRFDE